MHVCVYVCVHVFVCVFWESRAEGISLDVIFTTHVEI